MSENQQNNGSAIAVAVIIGAITLFVLKYPRTAVAILIGALVWAGIQDILATQRYQRLTVSVQSLPGRCAQGEIFTTIRNNHPTQRLARLRITITGYQPEFADSIYEGEIYSDRIIAPRSRIISACHTVRARNPNVRTHANALQNPQLRWEIHPTLVEFID